MQNSTWLSKSLHKFNIKYNITFKKSLQKFNIRQNHKFNNNENFQSFNDNLSSKEVVKWLLDKVPTFSVEYTKHGNPKPKYFDIADAIVISKAGLVKLNERTKNSNS